MNAAKNFRWVETGVRIWQLESPVGSRRFHGIVYGDTDTPVFCLPGGFTVSLSDGRHEEHGQGERATVRECKREVEKAFFHEGGGE